MSKLKQQVLDILLHKINDPNICEHEALFIIDEIEFFILEYCNIRSVPTGLKYTWVNMAYEKYIKDAAFKFQSVVDGDDAQNADENDLKSLSVDGISLTFTTDADAKSNAIKEYEAHKNLEPILLDYIPMLNKYRKVKW